MLNILDQWGLLWVSGSVYVTYTFKLQFKLQLKIWTCSLMWGFKPDECSLLTWSLEPLASALIQPASICKKEKRQKRKMSVYKYKTQHTLIHVMFLGITNKKDDGFMMDLTSQHTLKCSWDWYFWFKNKTKQFTGFIVYSLNAGNIFILWLTIVFRT